ncbi:MAG: AEC family transporter [Betaproteobacteria bacterium]|nr:AEC family transporter [Betaproteobacteria bacterium]
MSIALSLLPDFALILFGHLLRRFLHLGDSFWAGLEKLVYFVLFPALLFHALVRTPIRLGEAAPLWAAGLAAMGCGMVLGLAGRPLFGQQRQAFASQFQCAFRYNSYIGLAVAGNLGGVPGIAAMGLMVGAMVPLANVASVWMLARHGGLHIGRELARNPLILATFAGLACNLAGLELPGAAAQFLGRLSEASITLGLLAVGAALRLRGATTSPLASAWLLAVKLAAVPAAAWLAARGLGLEGVYFDTALLFGALPTATSAYILAVRMGGDGPGVAWLVSANTLLAMVTMPLWVLAIR